MKNKPAIRLLFALLALLIAVPLAGTGCQKEQPKPPAQIQTPAVSSPGSLGATLVPNVELDNYFYLKQKNPTTVPGNVLNISHDVSLVSAAVWGVPVQDTYAFGVGVTLSSANDASELYEKIGDLGNQGWKKLSDNTIYLVSGSNAAAESLKKAISNNDFKYFDNKELLEAASAMPDRDTTKLAAIWVGKPSEPLMNFATQYGGAQVPDQATAMLTMAQITAIAIGVYSPQEVDIAKIIAMSGRGGRISDLNMGLLAYVKSNLPGILVEPAIAGFLKEPDFTKTNLGELTVYKGFWNTGKDNVPILVRLNGNRIFAAAAGQESYAQTLIKSVE